MEHEKGWQYLKRTREQVLEDQSRPYDSKKNVWIPDAEEGFMAAEIKSGGKTDMVTVVTAAGKETTLKKELLQEMNPPKFEKTEDMANLTFLNDASVLYNLRSRYAAMLIYTYSGLFCVVINPYKRLPIYTDSVARMYIGKRRTEMPPHLFAVSDEAYRNMLQNHENQSMLITGESGAGKTENTKKVICYFASVGASQAEAGAAAAAKMPGGAVVDTKKVTLEDQIVRTNPVLEAFGNAKTVRNNNSSRFGKFIRIQFSKYGKVASCDIEHYLLEKSRVIRQAPGERCYHIFYQVFSGFKPTLVKELQLDKPLKDYWFVAQAELQIDGVDDKEEHGMTDESFDVLRFSQEEKLNCYRLVSGIMHMGNMKFKQRPREEQAETDGTDEAEKTSAMYGVDFEDLLKALTKPRVRVGNEWVNKGQNVDQVAWAVGAMAKGLYARMFHWIVKKCNITLDQKGIPRDFFIGVLDIAGFEIFDFNSFEQLWINFVNEKLQQFFNHHMFVLEQEEYAREGIEWTFIDFGLDLQACIELIEKPLGIISMLDEECIVPKATDMTLAQKLNEQHLGKHPNFEKPKPPKGKQAEAHFAMRHYAGTVRYNVTNWLEKNKDPLNDSFVTILKSSPGNALMQEVWQDYTTQEETMEMQKAGKEAAKKKGKSGSFMTVSMMYRESLNNLMNMLHKTHPHFIRCIIPNEKKASGVMDAALVLHQLTCNGVLEGIRICRKGFPNRTQHADFVQRYAILGAEEAKSSPDPKIGGERVMLRLVKEKAITAEMYRIGHTKVFFKAGVVAHLEDLRDEKLGFLITGFQAQIRQHVALIEKKRRQDQVDAITVLQKNIRSWCLLRTWEWFKLYGRVKPMLKAGKVQEEIDKLNDKIKDLEDTLDSEETMRKELEEKANKLLAEKTDLLTQLENARGNNVQIEDRLNKLNAAKSELEKALSDASERLADQENKTADVTKAKKKVESECETLKKSIQDLELNLRKSESEKAAKENQIRSLQDEIHQQDEAIAKLNKEKKHQEEVNRKLTEDLHAEEDKTVQMNKIRAKLEQTLDELQDSLEREKRARQDTEKAKRKLEGDLKIAQENLDEITHQKHDVEATLKKKESDLHAVSVRLEDEQALVGRLQRQVKEDQSRIAELEEELENERQARAKSDRAKADLQREIEELSERLDEAGGATSAQIELNKKREAELAKLRHDLEESNLQHETQLSALRKKSNDAVAELGSQLDQLQKQKAKTEKDRGQMQRQLDDLAAQLDSETKSKVEHERVAKMYELQLNELQMKADEQQRQLQESLAVKGRMSNENIDLSRQVEDLEAQLSAISRVKAQYASQLEEAKRMSDEETRQKQAYAVQAKNFQHEAEQLRDSLEEEIQSKSELLRQLSKSNSEIQQWKAKFEGEGLVGVDELEDVKRKQLSKTLDLQEALDAANSKIVALEKARARLIADLEDAHIDVERANGTANQLEKKQKGFDKVLDEWKKKCDDLHHELDAAQRDARNLSTESFKLKSTQDTLQDQVEGLRRENKNLAQEIKDLSDQLGEGGRSVHEMQKMVRRLELEKDELQHALDEAEAALEAEESKVLRSQVEVSQIRSEIEKRIQEKEEEFENTRKNHQRAIDSMQASLETESKGRSELTRIKKKLESDINELEIALDHANKANVDAQKNIKRHFEQIKELQMQVDEEQRRREDFREQYLASEKRIAILQSEKEEYANAVESAERARRQAELELSDMRETTNELSAQNSNLTAYRRKLEADIQLFRADLDETVNELKASEERGKKGIADAARLAEELRQEQEHSLHIERIRKSIEQQVKEMQSKLEDAEGSVLKGGKKVIGKLESRIRQVEQELDSEQRRYQDANKNLSKQDRRLRELQFQVDEDKKNFERLQDLVDKLQGKIKIQKRQIEEAEELATINLQKYKQIHSQLENAEERADVAENSLAKMRAKSRSDIVSVAVAGSGGGGAQNLHNGPAMIL